MNGRAVAHSGLQDGIARHARPGGPHRDRAFEDAGVGPSLLKREALLIGPDGRGELYGHRLGDHPACGADDFTIVEEASTGAIISSMVLISQTWTYDGIAFGVGRPELVGTAPAYRRRGLVRRQFEVLHQWSAERHERLQAITGIPWYYRQFGYEMALNLGGGRVGYRPHIPCLKDGETEPYRVRPVT